MYMYIGSTGTCIHVAQLVEHMSRTLAKNCDLCCFFSAVLQEKSGSETVMPKEAQNALSSMAVEYLPRLLSYMPHIKTNKQGGCGLSCVYIVSRSSSHALHVLSTVCITFLMVPVVVTFLLSHTLYSPIPHPFPKLPLSQPPPSQPPPLTTPTLTHSLRDGYGCPGHPVLPDSR